jgi:uncharacterized protein (DUF2062 family)
MNQIHNKLLAFAEKKIVEPLYNFIKLGLSPVKLSIAISLGATLGLCPVFGTTTILCGLLAIIFRLNMAVMQLVNYLMLPLQLVLLIPLIKTGAYIFSSGSSKLSAEMILNAFKYSWLNGMKEVGHLLLMGGGAWAIIIIPMGLILFIILVPVLKKVAATYKLNLPF